MIPFLRSRVRATVTVAGTLAAALIAGGPVGAQAPVCMQLEDELARLSSIGPTEPSGRWDRALRDLIADLEGLEEARYRARCDGGGFLFGRADPRRCAILDREIGDLRREIDRLDRRRAEASRPPPGVAERIRAVRQELRLNRCGAPDYRAASRGPGRPLPNRNGVIDARPRGDADGLFGLLFEGERDGYYRDSPGYGRDWDYGYNDRRAGTYRTLCVRTCDGYYFPISFSTTSDNFDRDEASCQAMCPKAPVELYTHRNPGEDASAMMSLAGTPYRELENAFRYRKEFVPECSCGRREVEAESGLRAITRSGDVEVDEPLYDDRVGWGDALAPADGPVALPSPKPAAIPAAPGAAENGTSASTGEQKPGDTPPSDVAAAPDAVPPSAATADTASETASTPKTGSGSGAGGDTASKEAAAAERKGGVRIVGPDYFVAQ